MNDKFVLNLIEKFDAASIAELDLDDGAGHLILRKEAVFCKAPAQPSVENAAAKAGGQYTAQAAAETVNAPAQVHLGLPVSTSGNETIKSPIVATFYGAPSPDAPPFVKPGARVKAGDSLCILEAMKMMNHLEAEFDCEIISALVTSGDMVEYGQALFEVRRL